ncbi:hypothetical protein N0V90_001119 [Kalmusia sp. IMI 367209]|nr:hypothetical protein N0V90_001119 [Kalmusia sp. IMI 367209]
MWSIPFPDFASDSPELDFDEIERHQPSPTERSEETPTEWVDTSRESTYGLRELEEDLARMGLPWCSEMRSIEASIVPTASDPGLPPYYVGIWEAGSGQYGTVILCLPRYYAVAAKWYHAHDAPLPLTELKSKLVAVKVASTGGIEHAQNEAGILKTLAEHMEAIESAGLHYFTQLRGCFARQSGPYFGIPDEASYWLATDAVFPSLTLGRLEDFCRDAGVAIPEELTLHILNELMTSLEFLHSHAIAHGDISTDNILVQLTDGLPNVIMADFGLAMENGDCEGDFESLQGEIHFLCSKARDSCDKRDHSNCTHSNDWFDFRAILMSHYEVASFESVLKRLVGMSLRMLETTTSEKKAEMAKLLRDATVAQENQLASNFRTMGLI